MRWRLVFVLILAGSLGMVLAPFGQSRTRAQPLPSVAAAVQAAVEGAPIPSPLTPALGRLRDDFYFFPGGCVPDHYQVCRFGDIAAGRTLVVLGDSHAQMWMPDILALAQQDGWTVFAFAKPGCIAPLWSGRGECGRWHRWALARAQALRPDVALVINSRSGVGKPLTAVKPTEELRASLAPFAGKVIVLGDEPSQVRDPLKCLAAPDATMATCSTRSTSTQVRAERAVAADARRSGAGYISVLPWFCGRPRGGVTGPYVCPMVIGGMIVPIDRGHLTRSYVLTLAPVFTAAFEAALRSPAMQQPGHGAVSDS